MPKGFAESLRHRRTVGTHTASMDEKLQDMIARAMVAVGCILAAATVYGGRDYMVDDALISLTYAENLLLGNGLVFNLGEYVEGFTNLGYVLAVAGLGALGMDLTLAARLLGLAGAITAVMLGPAILMPNVRKDRMARALARLLLLSNFSFVYLATTGMETTFYVGLICLTCWLYTRGGFGWLVGLLAGLIFMVRPDGALIGAALIVVSVFSVGIPKLIKSAGPWVWVAVILAVEAWRYSYYGELVPNTALIKGGGGPATPNALPWYGQIGDDVVEMFAQTGGVIGLYFALVALIRYHRRDRVWLAVAILTAISGFAVYSGGDWMSGYRFLVPTLPFYLSLVAIGMVDVVALLGQARSGRGLQAAFCGLVVVVAAYCWSFGLEFYFHTNRFPNTHMTSSYMIPAAKWLDEKYPAGYQVTAGAIGSLAYYSDLVVIDNVGLTDQRVAEAHRNGEGLSDYFAERNPELVLLNGTHYSPAQRMLYGREYRLERFFRRGINKPWALYVRADLPEAATATEWSRREASPPGT